MKDTMCGLVKEVNAPSGLVYHTDLSIPEINDDEVLIKVHCSAICGTDLHMRYFWHSELTSQMNLMLSYWSNKKRARGFASLFMGYSHSL